MRNIQHATCLTIFSLLLAASAAAQSATLAGTVTDPSGAPVEGALISAASPAPGARAESARTDAAGRYSLSLPPGRWRVRIAGPEDSLLAAAEREWTLAAGETREWSHRFELARLAATVVVTAHAEPLATRQTSAAVSIVTRSLIEQRQAVWLSPLLETLPGVSIGRNGREGGVASLFSGGGNREFTKVLVDGAPLNEPGGAIDLSPLALDNIEKVEMVRGAESALHGSDAMMGVLQIFTRRGTTARPVLRLTAEGGTFASARGAADFSGVWRRLDYSLAAGRFETSGQEPNDVFRLTTLSGNFGIRAGESHQVRLALRSSASHAGVPGQTLFQPAPNLDQHNALRNFTASLSWDFATGARWRHKLAATESYVRQLFDNPASDFCDPSPPFICDFPFTTRNQYNRAGLAAQSSYLAGAGAVTFGYQNEVENAGIARGHLRRVNHGGYADARWSWKRLLLSGGFRVEGNDAFGTRFVPRAGFAVLLRDAAGRLGATRLRGSFGLGVKEPQFVQSFGFSDDPCFPGNPALRPERSRALNVGVEQRLAGDRVRVVAEGYYNRFRDIVSFTFCLPGGPCPVAPPPGCPFGFGSFFNTDLARAYGANLMVESRPARWLTVSGHYTLTQSLVLEAPNAFDPALVAGQPLLRRPAHRGSIHFAASLQRWHAGLSGIFVGPRTDSDFLGLGLTRNAGYARFDFFSSLEMARGVTLFGRIENLFDRRYQENLGYPALRRTVRGGMRFTFGPE
jgi:vitamin B12 transporter